MSLYIRNPETDRLARTLADRTGSSLTEAVTAALKNELARCSGLSEGDAAPGRRKPDDDLLAFVRELQDRVAAQPVLEEGTDEELLYDEDGIPR